MMLNLTLDPASLATALRGQNICLSRKGKVDTNVEVVEAVGYPRAENGRYGAILTARAGHVAMGWSRTWALLVACYDPDGKPGGCVHLRQLRLDGETLKTAGIAARLGLSRTTTGRLFEDGGKIVLEITP